MKKETQFVKSKGENIYVELVFPHKKTRGPAVVVGHGLRSYYPGFLDMFAKRLRDAGYISVKFHYVGTGRSSGKFEDKLTSTMLQNYKDVISYLKKHPSVTTIGVMGRSNSGSLAVLAGPDPAIKAYVLLAPPAFYSLDMSKFAKESSVKGKFFYHKSFKRPHTKGPGRLPFYYLKELKTFDQPLLRNIPKVKRVQLFQSTADEAVPMSEGHFDYWSKHLPQPKKMVVVQGGNHSFKGHKSYVIKESIKWFKKYLPLNQK